MTIQNYSASLQDEQSIEMRKAGIAGDNVNDLRFSLASTLKTQWERVPCTTDGGRLPVRTFVLPGADPIYKDAEGMRAPMIEFMNTKIGDDSSRNYESPPLGGQETQWEIASCTRGDYNQPIARTFVPLKAGCSNLADTATARSACASPSSHDLRSSPASMDASMAYPMPSRSAEDIVRALYDEQSTVRTLFPPAIGPHPQPVLTEVLTEVLS